MTYVVADPCLTTKDRACVDVCPVSCFYEGTDQLYINPDECVDCDACLPACPVAAIFPLAEVPAEWQHFIKKAEDFFAANPGVQPCKGKGEVGSGGYGPNAVPWPPGAQSPPVAEGGKAAAGPAPAGAAPPKGEAEPAKPAAAPASPKPEPVPAAAAAPLAAAPAPPPAPVPAAPLAGATGGSAPAHIEAALSAVEAAVHAARAAAEAAEAAARAMRAAIGGSSPPLAGPGSAPRAPETKPAAPTPPAPPAQPAPKAAVPAVPPAPKQAAPAAKPAAAAQPTEKPSPAAKTGAPPVFPQDLYGKGKEILGRLVQVQTATVPFDPQVITEAQAISKQIRGEIAEVMGGEVTSLVELEKKGVSWRQAEELARGLIMTLQQTQTHAVNVERKRRELVEAIVGFVGTGAVCAGSAIMAWKSAIELSLAPGSTGSLLDILKAPLSPEGLAPIIGYTIIAGLIAPFTIYAGCKSLGRFKELAGLRRNRITALAHLKAVQGTSQA